MSNDIYPNQQDGGKLAREGNKKVKLNASREINMSFAVYRNGWLLPDQDQNMIACES